MHRDHVEKHKVPCSPCHNEILHKWGDEYITNILPERNADSGDKNSSMASVVTSRTRQEVVSVDTEDQESVFEKAPYLIQKKLYAGKGGFGIGDSPGPDVSRYCKLYRMSQKYRDMSVHPLACNVCHEKGFDKTMAEQKEYITGMLSSLVEIT